MQWLQSINVDVFLLFTLVLCRVSGLMISAPAMGTPDIPMQVRALLSLAVALLVLPTQTHVEISQPGTTLNYLVLVGAEVTIGLCLGLGVSILLSGVQLGGQISSIPRSQMLNAEDVEIINQTASPSGTDPIDLSKLSLPGEGP